MTEYLRAVRKEITRRVAQKIRDAHQRGDELMQCIDFRESEIRNGADPEQAIKTTFAMYPDLDFQTELTEILEAALAEVK